MLHLALALTAHAADLPTWRAPTLTLPDRLAGHTIHTTEVDGWIQRATHGGASLEDGGVYGGLGASGVGYGGGGADSRARPSRSIAPRAEPHAMPPAAPMAVGSAAPPPPHKREGAVAPQQAGPLRAGVTDDNEAFGAFLEFLDTWKDRPGVAGNHVPMDVAKRSTVRAVGADGAPVPGARVTVARDGALLWSGTTYGDGRAPYYPDLLGAGARGPLEVQITHDGRAVRASWDGSAPLELRLDARTPDALALDVAFVIDTTGSMSDEIDRIKATLLAVTAEVQRLDRPVDLRYGAVLYRDVGDAYLTRHLPLTRDLVGFDAKLQGIEAGGGGDGPESYNQALAVAVEHMGWREGAAKLAFVVADAPPHMDYDDDVPYSAAAQAALARGIRVHTVAASGLDDFGSLVFRQTAQLTQGRFVFIEYGSVAASAADHGVTGPVQSNNLDAILLRQIKREVEEWGTARVAAR